MGKYFGKDKPVAPKAVEPVVAEVVKEEKPVKEEVPSRTPSPDDVVVDGKLFEKVNVTENGCVVSKLVEVKE